MNETKFLLPESAIPDRWYNIQADMPNRPQPVLHPGTGEPVGPDDLAPLFPMAIILQEVSGEAEIPIPDEIRDVYRLWRPTPLYRARRLEEALGTGSRIFYKYEGVSPAGSHKPNTAVAQAYYIEQEGRARVTTETGAGQWGSALALATRRRRRQRIVRSPRLVRLGRGPQHAVDGVSRLRGRDDAHAARERHCGCEDVVLRVCLGADEPVEDELGDERGHPVVAQAAPSGSQRVRSRARACASGRAA